MVSNKQGVIGAAVALALLTAACSGNSEGSRAATPATTRTQAPVASVATAAAVLTPKPLDASSPSTLTVANREFNYGSAVWQAYWLSRDHFGPFVMGSGLGIPFEPPMEMLQAAMKMVAQNPADAVMIPANMVPLQAVFASGSPRLVNDPMAFAPMDFQGLRLDPATFDKRVTVRAQAETMLKESQWARNFASSHFGAPADPIGRSSASWASWSTCSRRCRGSTPCRS